MDDQREDGTDILIEGGIVVMDDCDFHHSNLASLFLGNILAEKGVQLGFRPPCSPELSAYELCFNRMERWLGSHAQCAQGHTVLATADSINYFSHCGYL